MGEGTVTEQVILWARNLTSNADQVEKQLKRLEAEEEYLFQDCQEQTQKIRNILKSHGIHPHVIDAVKSAVRTLVARIYAAQTMGMFQLWLDESAMRGALLSLEAKGRREEKPKPSSRPETSDDSYL